MKNWQLVCDANKGSCFGRQEWLATPPLERRSILPYPMDEDGYILCPFCKKVLGTEQFSRCPICDKYYKGYKRYPKYHFPCPECE